MAIVILVENFEHRLDLVVLSKESEGCISEATTSSARDSIEMQSLALFFPRNTHRTSEPLQSSEMPQTNSIMSSAEATYHAQSWTNCSAKGARGMRVQGFDSHTSTGGRGFWYEFRVRRYSEAQSRESCKQCQEAIASA